MFFLGLLLMIWEITIYRITVIDYKILLLLIFSVSSIFTILDFNAFENTFEIEGSKLKLYFLAFIQNTVSWGFIACSTLVLSNYYLATDEITSTRQFDIIDRSSMPGPEKRRSERKPLIRIDYDGKRKELVFPHEYYPELEAYKRVTITTKKGFCNFDIIVQQNLEK